MMAMRGLMVAVMVGSLLASGGCGGGGRAGKATGSADAKTQQQAITRGNELKLAVQAFSDSRARLVGHADDEGRRAFADSFHRLASVLKLLEGEQPGGAFQQQLRIIERAAAQIGGRSAAAVEPTIDSAVRAAANALSHIKAEQFSDDQEVQKRFDALRPRVDELDSVRGPLHGLVAAQAFDAIGQVVERMSEIVDSRMPEQQPATAPSSVPTASPS